MTTTDWLAEQCCDSETRPHLQAPFRHEWRGGLYDCATTGLVLVAVEVGYSPYPPMDHDEARAKVAEYFDRLPTTPGRRLSLASLREWIGPVERQPGEECALCEGEGRYECDWCAGRGKLREWPESPLETCGWCDGTGEEDCDCLDPVRFGWIDAALVNRHLLAGLLPRLDGETVEVWTAGKASPVYLRGDRWIVAWMPMNQAVVFEDREAQAKAAPLLDLTEPVRG